MCSETESTASAGGGAPPEQAAAPAPNCSKLSSALAGRSELPPPFFPSGYTSTGTGAATPPADTPPAGADLAEGISVDNPYVVLKYLVGSEAAGSIIGKHGATVAELETGSGAKLQLSKVHEYFPGTSARTVSMRGPLDKALTGLSLTLGKLGEDDVNMLSRPHHSPADRQAASQIAMVVPARLCGGLIGRAGVTLRSFMDDSGAQLMVSSMGDVPGQTERILYITGTKEQQVAASALIATKMALDPSYSPEEVPLTYPTSHTADAAHHHHDHHLHSEIDDAFGEKMFVKLPDEAIGVVIGKHGSTIQAIRERSGAKVKIEESHGPEPRLLTVQGSPTALEEVDKMLVQLVFAWGIQHGPTDGRRSLDGRPQSNAGSRRSSIDVSSLSRRSVDGHSHGHGHGHYSHSQTASKRSSIDSDRWRPTRLSEDSSKWTVHKNQLSSAPKSVDETKVMASSFYN